ncbi:MAG: asparagine synthase-related protein, partial [Kangiellaceae bacterium]|nr:asparagine synthase-related protein [Kangiellaceae bacterium]
MCSIFAILGISSDPRLLRKQALTQSKRQRHRGPDWSGIFLGQSAVLVHERLAIVDVEHGSQPLVSADGELALAVNGEIYNHQVLKELLNNDYDFQTASDCEVILALYREKGSELLSELNGMFAFVLYDATTDSYLVARDPIGIIPLYYGYDAHGQLQVASELKALEGFCQTIEIFPPGHYLDSREAEIKPYYQPGWIDYHMVADKTSSTSVIRESLTQAVKRHLMTDVPYGVLLSGGLDSSIIAALVKQFDDQRIEDDG